MDLLLLVDKLRFQRIFLICLFFSVLVWAIFANWKKTHYTHVKDKYILVSYFQSYYFLFGLLSFQLGLSWNNFEVYDHHLIFFLFNNRCGSCCHQELRLLFLPGRSDVRHWFCVPFNVTFTLHQTEGIAGPYRWWVRRPGKQKTREQQTGGGVKLMTSDVTGHAWILDHVIVVCNN